jgi:hypothetical protein
MRSRLAPTIGALLLAVASLGCDSPGQVTGLLVTPASGQVQVRMLNALTASQSLAFVVDQQVATSGVGFGGASPYVPMAIGTHRLQAEGSTTGTTLVDFTRDLSAAGSYSMIPATGLSQFGALFVLDDLTTPAGQAKLRLIHLAAAPGPVSVYLIGPTGDPISATPILTLAFGAASPYATVAPGTYRIRVTPAGVPSSVLLDSGSFTVASGSVRTLLLTDAPGGGLPSTLSIIADAN